MLNLIFIFITESHWIDNEFNSNIELRNPNKKYLHHQYTYKFKSQTWLYYRNEQTTYILYIIANEETIYYSKTKYTGKGDSSYRNKTKEEVMVV